VFDTCTLNWSSAYLAPDIQYSQVAPTGNPGRFLLASISLKASLAPTTER